MVQAWTKKTVMEFEGLAREYESWAAAHKAESTIHREHSKMKLLLSYFGEYELEQITVREVERYMEKRLREVKSRTVNLELALLRHMLSKAVDWEYLPYNSILKVKPLKEPSGRVRYLTGDEYDRLLIACQLIPGLYPVVLTALETGMRKGDLMSLTWDDIDFQRKEITLRETKNNELHHIPISNVLYPLLDKLTQDKRGLVFKKSDGTSYGDPYHRFIRACSWAGLTNFRFHDLRHTFASRLVQAGVRIRTVQELMGHKDIKMTMRYTHLTRSHLKKAINQMNDLSLLQTRMQL